VPSTETLLPVQKTIFWHKLFDVLLQLSRVSSHASSSDLLQSKVNPEIDVSLVIKNLDASSVVTVRWFRIDWGKVFPTLVSIFKVGQTKGAKPKSPNFVAGSESAAHCTH